MTTATQPTQSRRTKQSGSQRAETERRNLKKSNLLGFATGFSKFCRKPMKTIEVAREVYEPSQCGLSEANVVRVAVTVRAGFNPVIDPALSDPLERQFYENGGVADTEILLDLNLTDGSFEFVEVVY